MFEVTSDTVEAVVEEIEKRGWCQHRAKNLVGQVCILGGLWQAMGYADRVLTEEEYNIWTYAEIRLAKLMDVPFISTWNDTEGRTKEEVLDKLTGVAKYLRNEGK